jgi:hypothetical protein
MYGLPTNTELNKQLSKERVFVQFKVNRSAQDAFNADISTMFISNHISEATVPGLKTGKTVQCIYVLTLNLKHLGCGKKNLELLAKAIPQNMIFALAFENTVQFAVYYENLYVTVPLEAVNAKLQLQGTDLDEIWENLIKSVGGIVVEGDNTLKEQIEVDDARAKLQKQIDSLTEKAYKEKQPRRKTDLINQIKNLEQQLKKV